jgi:hypothetical protein
MPVSAEIQWTTKCCLFSQTAFYHIDWNARNAVNNEKHHNPSDNFRIEELQWRSGIFRCRERIGRIGICFLLEFMPKSKKAKDSPSKFLITSTMNRFLILATNYIMIINWRYNGRPEEKGRPLYLWRQLRQKRPPQFPGRYPLRKLNLQFGNVLMNIFRRTI